MSATVEITEENGRYRARDNETGATGTGTTRATALAVLAARLGAEEELTDANLEAELRALTEETRRRFENEDVTEDDVVEAIEWARSE
ncbi:hypothetical protein [Halobacteriaceae bacterium SHR40]|uniref:hypothetical protein n=1 Tax=Halovenus amylolytica TaxID=2500550 RepID=UPI000FE376EE